MMKMTGRKLEFKKYGFLIYNNNKEFFLWKKI